jgi:hypothetical protein
VNATGGYAVDAQDNWAAIASLVLGILSFVTPVGIVTAPLAIVLGVSARRRAAAGAHYGGLATAGLVLGIVGLLVGVMFLVGVFMVTAHSGPIAG